MTRGKAAAIHLTISACIGVLALILFLVVWYPPPYFRAAGANELILLLVGVDLSIGPLLTLIVFKPGKWGLKFDLAVIGVLQFSALVYGSHVVLESRPVFLVGVLDRFVLVSADEILDSDLVKGQEPRFRQRSWTGPVLVLAEQPKSEQERSDLAFSALSGRDLQNLPQYYRDFEKTGAELLKAAKTIPNLVSTKPQAQAAVAAAEKTLNRNADSMRWLPLQAPKEDMVMLIDAASAQPLKAIPVDPW